ncbi:MAG: hypothetical protein WC523_00005, partial [Patescibacteria group bacterium]
AYGKPRAGYQRRVLLFRTEGIASCAKTTECSSRYSFTWSQKSLNDCRSMTTPFFVNPSAFTRT